MLTVLESIKLSTEYLQNKEIESPRINAELLLAKILNCKRLDLYLMFDRPLMQEEIEQYREFIRRRSKNEPLQYIVGSVEFYGIEFLVNSNVLIPRQETEILVESIIKSFDANSSLTILDIGSGSGNIAIVLAKYFPNSTVVSIDISQLALETAIHNAKLNAVDQRIIFKMEDITKQPELERNFFEVIVSNPPYVSSEQYKDLQPELKIYEPKIALTDNSDGFTFYKLISAKAKSLLKQEGKIFFEVGEGQSQNVVDILTENDFNKIRVIKDYLNIDRVITGDL